ncbi:MAG: SpoIID/LytB domain-containing protein [Candidatus Omnitrophica bacterium]|nr:SpoIID/LytB domain-containing protein [Candidatus Omnitrophota bacterium]
MFQNLTRFILLTALVLCVSGESFTPSRNMVRVAVVHEVDHCTLSVDGRYEVVDGVSGKRVEMGIRLKPSLVALEGGAIKIGDRHYENQRVLLEPRRESLITVNDKRFRGDMMIINNAGKSITVVNAVELEEYIRGVLYHEISDKWPLEAIQAQAVATRTYALYSVEKFAGRDYDMTSDIYSQVYGGQTAERYRTNVAVRRTQGEVLTYKGKIFPAFFHANSGGETEDASELWDVNLPPLKGGVQSPFSVNSPHYKWRKNFWLKDIEQRLAARGYDVGPIKELRIVALNQSGRVRQIEIISRAGKSVKMDGKTFREVIGPNDLKSNKYTISMKGWFVDFAGYGWGHGVGLDQWGAYNMALLHYDYKKILEFYYPSSEIQKYDKLD